MATGDAEYIGVNQLAQAAELTLSEIGDVDRKMKSGATEIPTERTIRFYLEKGLLPKPRKRLGQTLVFSRVHLLHLLVIKKLQADGVPLSAVGDILKKKGKTEAQLEELLKEEVQIFRSRRSLDEYRKRTGHTDDSDVVVSYSQAAMRLPLESELPSLAAFDEPLGDELAASFELIQPEEQATSEDVPQASEAKSYLRSLLSRRGRLHIDPPRQKREEEQPPRILFSRMPPAQPERWTRHEPADGLEINISDDYEAPTDEHGRRELLEEIRRMLGI